MQHDRASSGSAKHHSVRRRRLQPTQHGTAPTAGSSRLVAVDHLLELGAEIPVRFLTSLARPGDESVTTVTDETDRPVRLIDILVALAMCLDEVDLSRRSHGLDGCRAFLEPNHLLSQPLRHTVDVVDDRGPDPIGPMQENP
jgi:hypothetical protein